MWSPTWTANSQSPVNCQNVEAVHHSHSSHQLPPPISKTASLTASFRSVLHRLPARAPSSNSLHSAFSAASSKRQPAPPSPQTAHPTDYPAFHPFAAMVAGPLPVVSSHDALDNDEDCPVCLESLSFSFRLPGEKPHIVPECGHALHEVSVLRCIASRLSLPLSFRYESIATCNSIRRRPLLSHHRPLLGENRRCSAHTKTQYRSSPRSGLALRRLNHISSALSPYMDIVDCIFKLLNSHLLSR